MIKFAGIQKTSLIDYPGHISTILFTQGCNLRCPYCHNPDLIKEETDKMELLSSEDVLLFLKERSGKIDGITLTGGEPLMQDIRDLKSFLFQVKELGLKVKLDTNGSFHNKLAELVAAGLVDYIAMDVKLPYDRYKMLGGKINIQKFLRSVYYIFKAENDYNIDYEFRTTVVPGIHSIEDIKRIALHIQGAENYYIQNFRGELTLNKELQGKKGFSEKKLLEFKEAAEEYLENVYIRN